MTSNTLTGRNRDLRTAIPDYYTYDSLNRLSTATGTGWGESYTYDGFGNLTDKNPTSGSPPALHVAVNAANNRLVGYTYDADGNMTIMSGTTFTYDVANRVATVLPSGGGTEQYSYGPDNLRVWKLPASGNEELHFYGVFGERLGTYSIANNYGRGYKVFQGPIDGYFAGKIIWSQVTDIGGGVVSGTGREVAQNRLGSVAGSYPNGTYYYPYGEDTGTPLLGDNFATYYRDGTTGLDYAKNRYYSPILGRFNTPDPSGSDAADLSDPGSWNMYAYAGGDPINFNDPDGLIKCSDAPRLETGQTFGDLINAKDDVFRSGPAGQHRGCKLEPLNHAATSSSS
ncbi:MAG TPA: RHS repeat-associated core domain-containing protein [Bryobacteraceae bacterium]|nr:RHS repeat-associated core domain-containing protein [Bryobacteraceae bacterium]